jgi:drug/metabolite transporter (DMT)-like permease
MRTLRPLRGLSRAPTDSAPGELYPSALIYLALWFAVVAWGGSFVAARLLLHSTARGQVALSPTVLAAVRFSIASLFFVVPLARAIVRRQVSGRDILRMAALGQIAYSIYFWLQYTGVQQTNASIASILVVGLIPLATAVLSRALGKEELSAFKGAALLLGCAGVAIVALQQGAQLARSAGFALGALCLVGNAFAFALYSTLSKRWMRAVSPLVMTGGAMLFGAIGLLLLSLTDPADNRWADVARLTPTQVIALLFLALVCSVAAYFAYNVALTRLPAGRAAVYIYFEPVVALVLGVTLLSERLSVQTMLGAALIAASVALVQRSGR